MRVAGKTFSYTSRELIRVESALSVERLSSYVVAAGGSRRLALELYEWNASVSAAFYVMLQNVEVGLRNACHRELSALYGPRWHDDYRFQSLGFRAALTDAKERIRRLGRHVDTSHIVAECPFGFWTTMFGRRFEHPLWNGALRRTFPRFKRIVGHAPSRREVAHRLDNLRTFRNRIAHYEPVFPRALASDYASLIETTAWIHPDFAAWTREVGRPCASLIASGSPVRRSRVIVAGRWCGPQGPHKAPRDARG